MLTKEEIKLVTHISNAGKGLIAITEILNRQRGVMFDYDLLTDIAECVNRKMAGGVQRGMY